jgi:hypothetical protein
VNDNEAKAIITSAQIYLGRYKRSKAALEEAKNTLEEYMDDTNQEDVAGTSPGSGARFVERQNRTLNLEPMADEHIIWCARNGLLAPIMGKVDALAQAARSSLQPFISPAAGTRYVDLYFPSWGSAKAQPTAQTAAPPSPPPVPKPAPAPTPKPAVQPTASLTFCPDHGKSRYSEKSGGLYCPSKLDDGSWCKWTTATEGKAA